MNKKRSKLFNFFLFSFLTAIALMVSIVIYIDLNLNKAIDLNIVRAGSSSITKIFYYNRRRWWCKVSDRVIGRTI